MKYIVIMTADRTAPGLYREIIERELERKSSWRFVLLSLYRVLNSENANEISEGERRLYFKVLEPETWIDVGREIRKIERQAIIVDAVDLAARIESDGDSKDMREIKPILYVKDLCGVIPLHRYPNSGKRFREWSKLMKWIRVVTSKVRLARRRADIADRMSRIVKCQQYRLIGGSLCLSPYNSLGAFKDDRRIRCCSWDMERLTLRQAGKKVMGHEGYILIVDSNPCLCSDMKMNGIVNVKVERYKQSLRWLKTELRKYYGLEKKILVAPHPRMPLEGIKELYSEMGEVAENVDTIELLEGASIIVTQGSTITTVAAYLGVETLVWLDSCSADIEITSAYAESTARVVGSSCMIENSISEGRTVRGGRRLSRERREEICSEYLYDRRKKLRRRVDYLRIIERILR